jgi:glycine betaine/proline transport system ATP-binding protein
METKIEIKHLYKIFGDDPQAMLQKVRDGVSKDELNDQCNHVLGLSDINARQRHSGGDGAIWLR